MWQFDGVEILLDADANIRDCNEANILALVRVLNDKQLEVLQEHMIAIIGSGGQTVIQLKEEELK